MLLVLLTPGALSDPVFVDTVVQHWLLAIGRDCIALGLSFESPPVRNEADTRTKRSTCPDVEWRVFQKALVTVIIVVLGK